MQKIKRCDNISNHKMIVKRKDGQFKYTYKIARAFQKIRGAERSARTGISRNHTHHTEKQSRLTTTTHRIKLYNIFYLKYYIQGWLLVGEII
jgi:hypothetical protein